MSTSVATPRRPTHRERLREATRGAHEQVDIRFSRFDLTTRAGYSAFLSAHSNVLPGLEHALSCSGAASLVPDWPSRLRALALAEDLLSIGCATAATPVDFQQIESPVALGMIYVLEGSRLGGAVLARRVADNTEPACRNATRYLRHGERRGLWTSFIAQFDTSSLLHDHEAAVIEGALAAFALFAAAANEPPKILGPRL